jgi:hypothetical protein
MIRLLNKTPDLELGTGEKRDAFLDWHEDKTHPTLRIVKKTTFLIWPNDDIKSILRGSKYYFFRSNMLYVGVLYKGKTGIKALDLGL